MPTNKYFNNFSYGREQDLIEDITIESIKQYGHSIRYMPKTIVRDDPLFGEDILTSYDKAAEIEVYIKDVEGFSGEGDFLSKFNLEIRDQITFTVARKRFDQATSEKLTTEVGYNYLLETATVSAVAASPVAHWTFEDGTVGQPAVTITDSAGTNNGTAFNGPVYVVAVQSGYGTQGLSFNGTNQNVLIPSTAGGPLELSRSFTVEAGLIHEGVGAFALFMGGPLGSQDSYFLNINGDGSLNFHMYFDDASTLDLTSSAGQIVNGKFQHIAAVFDDTGASNEMRLYVDQILVANTFVGSRVAGYDDPATNLWIGSINNGAFGFYNGILSDVRISDMALAASEFIPVSNSTSSERISTTYVGDSIVLEVGTSEGYAITSNRPTEGDLIYFPLVDEIFEIKFVEHEQIFYQTGRLQTYDIRCELFEYNNERFNTGNTDIDLIEDTYSTDILFYELLQEDGFKLLNEDGKSLMQEYRIEDVQPAANNEYFQSNDPIFGDHTIFDWSEGNPFSETDGDRY